MSVRRCLARSPMGFRACAFPIWRRMMAISIIAICSTAKNRLDGSFMTPLMPKVSINLYPREPKNHRTRPSRNIRSANMTRMVPVRASVLIQGLLPATMLLNMANNSNNNTIHLPIL